MSSESQFDYMDAVDTALTSTVLLRVEKFAEGRAKLLHNYGLPSDSEALAHDAVQDTFTSKRRWNPEKCELHQHLQGMIRSRVSHALRHREVARHNSRPRTSPRRC